MLVLRQKPGVLVQFQSAVDHLSMYLMGVKELCNVLFCQHDLLQSLVQISERI